MICFCIRYLDFSCKNKYIAFVKSRRRDIILDYLQSFNGYISGEEICRVAHCTPQNVSYHINILRKNGVDIGISHRGYRYIREVDNLLLGLKVKYKAIGILFENVRSCLDLKNISFRGERYKNLYYTFNEANFFYKDSSANLSFLTDLSHKKGILSLVISFLTNYLNGEVRVVHSGADKYLGIENYLFGRYISLFEREHFQIVINSDKEYIMSDLKVVSISKLLGDYIGIKGFSVLLFDYLYANLDESQG